VVLVAEAGLLAGFLMYSNGDRATRATRAGALALRVVGVDDLLDFFSSFGMSFSRASSSMYETIEAAK